VPHFVQSVVAAKCVQIILCREAAAALMGIRKISYDYLMIKIENGVCLTAKSDLKHTYISRDLPPKS